MCDPKFRCWKQLGLNLREEQINALVARGDFDKDQVIDYYEFVVRYGLEIQVPGKWIFQVWTILLSKFALLMHLYLSMSIYCHYSFAERTSQASARSGAI